METATASNVVEITKRCTKCGEDKPSSQFYPDRRRGGFLMPCKVCFRAIGKRWRDQNKAVTKAKYERALAAYDPAKSAAKRESHPTGLQRCSRCKIFKPFAEFCLSRARSIGISIVCRPCTSEKAKEWRQRKPEKAMASARRLHRLKKYGLSTEAFNALLSSQGGKCAVCRVSLATGSFRRHIDHDHETGKVRGILCNTCNTGIGMFQENPELIMAAIEYLLRARGEL